MSISPKKRCKGTAVEKNLVPSASAPVCSVNDGVRKGERNPGELQLKMNKIANGANVSNDAMHVCMASVTGRFSSANCANANFCTKPNLNT